MQCALLDWGGHYYYCSISSGVTRNGDNGDRFAIWANYLEPFSSQVTELPANIGDE